MKDKKEWFPPLPPEEWGAALAELIQKFSKIHIDKLSGGSRFSVARIYRADALSPAILEEIRSVSEEELRTLAFRDLGHVFFESHENGLDGCMMLVMKSAMEEIRPSN